MMRNKVVGAACALFMCVSTSFAEVTISREGTVPLKVEIGRPVEIIVEEGVADLVRSGDPATIKVEHTAGHLFVTPLTRDAAELSIIDTTGRSYRLQYLFDQGKEDRVVLKAAEKRESSETAEEAAVLLRQMILGKTPSGVTERSGSGTVFENSDIRLSLLKTYELPRAICYVLLAENRLERSLIVPLEQISFPGMVVVSASRELLLAKGKDGATTTLYMVASR